MNVDVIVVGSGPGGVNAAAPLVGAGLRVVMLDYANQDDSYARLIPDRPFLDLRRSDPEQHRYLLGERFEGIPLGGVRIGAQLTPPRNHVFRDAAERIPVDTDGFQASASLAQGGFGAAWAAGVFPFTGPELAEMGLDLDELKPHYDAVAERIGVSGERDDLERFLPASPSMMPALELDSNAEAIVTRYRRRAEAFRGSGFFLGGTRLAVSTRCHRGRGPERYLDLSYWSDPDRSVYRPRWSLEELERESSFVYRPRRFVERFEETQAGVRVEASHADGSGHETLEARALVLAAGTIGSSWLVLRSLGRYDETVPILCNPYAYAPMLNLGTLGRPVRDRRHSLAQLTGILEARDGSERAVQAQVFSYRSLLTFKLLKESPLSFRDGLHALRLLLPHFSVLGIHHEDRPNGQKLLQLRAGHEGPDRLRIDYAASDEELRAQRRDERALLRIFRKLGCLPLRILRPGDGANIHYAGTFPMRPEGGPLTCARDGRLRATRAVYLADGSLIPWLPAKGLTFTLMAHADRVGTLLARRLGTTQAD